MSNVNILVIEDNPGDTKLIETYLNISDNSFVIHNTGTLQEALNFKDDVNVILLDLNLPDSNGISTIKSIKSKFPATPIVVLTGLDDKNIALQAVQMGVCNFLRKSDIDSVQLVVSIIGAVNSQKLSNNIESEELLKSLQNIVVNLQNKYIG